MHTVKKVLEAIMVARFFDVPGILYESWREFVENGYHIVW